MRIIEKVEISKFRSIGDRESFEAKDLNIISGSNDSGKSNFLRACLKSFLISDFGIFLALF